MPQPTPYERTFSFSGFQAANPSLPLPAPRMDGELDGVAQTLSQVLSNLALIQRDDGALADGAVTIDSISAALFSAIVAAAGGGDYLAPRLTFTAHTLAPGAAATVTVTGVYPDLTVDLGVPKGDAAAPGAATLADADYGDVAVSAAGSHMKVETVLDGQTPSVAGHAHVIADITGLAAALAAKADGATTTAQLATKANAITDIESYNDNIDVNDGQNGQYWRLTGGVTKNLNFPTITAGFCAIYVNRSTVNWTVSCAGGYYKNGAAVPATANFNLAPGARMVAFHEGAGVWTFDGPGF